MNLNQMYPVGVYNPHADELGAKKDDSRRNSALTLRDLNKLKKLRAYRKLESLRRRDRIEAIYSIDDNQM